MSPRQVLDYFGTRARAARVLGCSQPAMIEWEQTGEVPEGRQYQIELATGGALRADLPADRTLGAWRDEPGVGKPRAPYHVQRDDGGPPA